MIKKLYPYTKGYRPYMLLGILCSAGEAVLELLLPLTMSNIVDIGIANGDRTYILTAGLKMAAMAAFAMLLGITASAAAARAGMGFGANLRLAVYEQVQKFSFSNIEHFSTASLITRLTNDVAAMQQTLMMGMRIVVRAPMMLLTALLLAATISLKLSRVFLVVIPLLAVVATVILRKVGPMFNTMQQATDDLNLVVQEDLNAIRVVKSFVREPEECKKFENRSTHLRKTAEHASGFVVSFMPLMIVIVYSTVIAVMWIGGHYVYDGIMGSGDLISFITYITEILMSLMMVSMILMMLSRSIACARRIIDVMDEAPEITNAAADPALEVPDGSVRFDHVSFKYHKTAEAWNLHDINFTVDAGMTVGILGGTGSAKTTLVSLIPRLYEATEGRVFVGGHPVQAYTTEHLRDACAMVLQQNTLFSGTVADNLRWGNHRASDEELREACRIACADEFINRMPEGYETMIDQGGTNISGGQKQRLCIARAILRKPKILILDDSTSAVDTATDAKIRQGLRQVLPGTTKLIIAQRVTSVMDADLILVMDDGAISAMGTHEQLLSSCRIYREVYESQQEGVMMDE